MKLRVSHPELASELVRALNDTDCLAARTGLDTVEVFAPWLVEGGDTAHAGTELLFFVKAWASRLPLFRVSLLVPRLTAHVPDEPSRPFRFHCFRPMREVESVEHGHATGRRDDR